MTATVDVRNESSWPRVLRPESIRRLASRVCQGERVEGNAEISLLLCDDAQIRELNRAYRRTDRPTDVLSFAQDRSAGNGDHSQVTALGDIVISAETVARRCNGDAAAMRAEFDLLFCHGLLHLLGYDHATGTERDKMITLQARYLKVPERLAWIDEPPTATGRKRAKKGGSVPVKR